jgi:glyoxylase-like metal-dependent hydrolase (beta-lactamase superfamily II)
LFIGGCGRFFEGAAEEMHKALNETLAALPDDTKVYPGHEYTKGNVKFAKTVSNNDAIKKLDEYSQANKQTQGKFTIGDEKVCCPSISYICAIEADPIRNITFSCSSQTPRSRRPLGRPSLSKLYAR